MADRQTICIDSISDIAEVLLREYKKINADARQAYGKMMDDVADLVCAFRDIPNKHVYMTAKQGYVTDEFSKLLKYSPVCPGKSLAANLPYWFDEVLALRIYQDDEGNEARYLQTQPDIQYTAKDRSGKLAPNEAADLSSIFTKILQPAA